jgi:hypothetical protein
MNEKAPTARIVRVTVDERHPGLFFGTSPDLRGLFIAKESLGEVLEAIPASIASLYEAVGEKVIVEPAVDSNNTTAWVAIPAGRAEAALARLVG